VLETQLIEEKLIQILESLTFRYSRQPEFMTVIPDRLTTENIRICEKIKLLNEQTMKDNAEVTKLSNKAKAKTEEAAINEGKAKQMDLRANRMLDSAERGEELITARKEAERLRVKAKETRSYAKILL